MRILKRIDLMTLNGELFDYGINEYLMFSRIQGVDYPVTYYPFS
jgi:hypothetical protein